MTENQSDIPSESPVETSVEPAEVNQHACVVEANVEPSTLKLMSLDAAFITMERVSGWIFASVVLCVGLVAMIAVAFSFSLLSLVTACCLLAYLLLGSLLAWIAQVLPKKSYDRAGWCLTPSGLEIRRGIWWRSQVSVPLARVQHTDVHQGPLMRRFGLAKLIVHTAGTENSAVELNGLSFATAQRLRDALVENRGDIDGV